jgi:light-regulated signal transduction histidine kinase (bacteriophytochrome)
MYAIAHATEEGIVIDLEPVDADGDEMLEGALRAQSSVKRAVSHVQDAFEKGAYFQSVTDELRALLGYDRVMLYRFHEDDHGEVVAESTSQHARDAFKGLHFPATDIPQANRKIFMSMRSRMIADVSGPASKVRQCKRTPDDILLSDSQLRGISGCHAQYLSNMGVKATLVVSVVVTAPRSAMRDAASDESRQRRRRSRGVSTSAADRESWDGGGDDDGGSQSPPQEKLWGLIVCHHYQGPHRVAYYQRSAAEFLVRVFSLQLSRILQSEQAKIESSLLSHQGTICKSLKYVEEMTGFNAELTPQIFSSVMSMEPGSSALFKVANASGAAMIIGDTIFHAGECPPDDEIAAIVAWVLQSKDAAPLHVVLGDHRQTDRLGQAILIP